SSFDMPIIRALFEKGKVDKDIFVVCNGFKRELYRNHITAMLNDGFKNVTPVLDHLGEIDHYEEHVTGQCQVGIRLASDEEPKFQFYTSRLGINYNDVV